MPRFPIYIPSKSRATIAKTPKLLNELGVPYSIIVEAAQHDEYAEVWGEDKLLVLPEEYQERYLTFDRLGDTKSRGPGPARNFAWEHSIEAGAPWHWVMDDNIVWFLRLHQNHINPWTDGTPLVAMEDFTLRWRNVAMAGPNYDKFAPARAPAKPFTTNTRIYSCNLIRNDVPFRWRGRYNEDTDLSLQMLKAGWCTIQFNAFLQFKMNTQLLAGGNTEAFYAEEGTYPKSEMLARMHPDCCRVVHRFSRIHHVCDYARFKHRRLVPRDDAPEPSTYELRPVARESRGNRTHSAHQKPRP